MTRISINQLKQNMRRTPQRRPKDRNRRSVPNLPRAILSSLRPRRCSKQHPPTGHRTSQPKSASHQPGQITHRLPSPQKVPKLHSLQIRQHPLRPLQNPRIPQQLAVHRSPRRRHGPRTNLARTYRSSTQKRSAPSNGWSAAAVPQRPSRRHPRTRHRRVRTDSRTVERSLRMQSVLWVGVCDATRSS